MRHMKMALLAALTVSTATLMQATATQAANATPFYRTFSGYTYPGNPGGLASCDAYGDYLVSQYGYTTYDCILNMPDAGMYGLYMITIPCYPECGANVGRTGEDGNAVLAQRAADFRI